MIERYFLFDAFWDSQLALNSAANSIIEAALTFLSAQVVISSVSFSRVIRPSSEKT